MQKDQVLIAKEVVNMDVTTPVTVHAVVVVLAVKEAAVIVVQVVTAAVICLAQVAEEIAQIVQHTNIIML